MLACWRFQRFGNGGTEKFLLAYCGTLLQERSDTPDYINMFQGILTTTGISGYFATKDSTSYALSSYPHYTSYGALDEALSCQRDVRDGITNMGLEEYNYGCGSPRYLHLLDSSLLITHLLIMSVQASVASLSDSRPATPRRSQRPTANHLDT